MAASLPLPLYGGGLNFGFQIEGRAPEKEGSDLTANYTALTPGYFRALAVPLLQGRLFSPNDTAGAPKVCLISAPTPGRIFRERAPSAGG